MNRNTIISLAMIYALWQSKHQDLLDLIQPFIVYAVGKTTSVGSEIDINNVCTYMEEFGYQSFQPAVVRRVLTREASFKKKTAEKKIIRNSHHFVLVGELSIQNDDFDAKRNICKEHSDKVTLALANFFNEKKVCNRTNYTQEEAEAFLLAFFERQGNTILCSVEDLRQITVKNNEINYFIGKFILIENEKKSLLMDYLVELVKGYFVTTAIYLQAENPNITTASFNDVTFYLDTRLLLAYLGYKSKQENDSVQEMIRSLQKNGAKLACFEYNIEEVNSILEAYKQSTLGKSKRPSSTTLEYFDEHGYSYTHVDAAQRCFEERLKKEKINPFFPSEILEKNKVSGLNNGLLDDACIHQIIISIKQNYNTVGLDDDIEAVNTISRVREGKKYPYIEKCRAVFVTSNVVLVSATKQYLKEISCDVGFPIAITSEDLCVLAWLKDFEQNNKLPQMRLLENVLAAITPTKELMDAYFSHLDNLERQGILSEDDVALLRVDVYARNELMELTHGVKENINNSVINDIRQTMLRESREDGYQQGKAEVLRQNNQEQMERINNVCKRAEEEVEEEYKVLEKKTIVRIKFFSLILACVFIVASILSFLSQMSGATKWALLIVTIVTTIEGVWPFISGENFIINYMKRKLQNKKNDELDKRKRKYVSLVK